MFGLLWLSLAVVLLVKSSTDTEWLDALAARDNPICRCLAPLTASSATTSTTPRMCGHCSCPAYQLLSTATECQKLQSGLLLLTEHVSSDVFGNAITTNAEARYELYKCS